MARGRTPFIPSTGDDLTPGWFTEVLADQYVGSTVVDVNREVIGDGIGFVGELHRCELTWETPGVGLPSTVVVKIPSANPKNRGLAETLGAYEREIVTYQNLAPKLGLPMPRCYYAAMDPHPAPWLDTLVLKVVQRLPLRAINWILGRLIGIGSRSARRYVLVLEDIDDARPPTQADGGSLDDAGAALRMLARSHSTTWCDDSLVAQSRLIWPISRAFRVLQASYARNRAAFFEAFGDDFDAAVWDRLDHIQADLGPSTRALSAPPTVLLHGDYRLDNILFRSTDDLIVVDYQAVGVGRPGWDVGYFLTTALSPEHRHHEADLVAAYHSELQAAGVIDYSMDALVEDVRLTIDVLAHRMVCADDLLDTERGDGQDTLVKILVHRVLGWTDY